MSALARDNETDHSYELLLDGEVVGELLYRKRDDVVTLIHTEVPAHLEGRGLGEQLVAGVLEDVRAGGLHIVPLCPFVVAFLRRHPEHGDLVK